jgi:hypothetical protein
MCTSAWSLQKADCISLRQFQRLCLCRQKLRFLAQTPLPTETVFGCMRLLPRKAEHLVLPGPFRW